MKLNWSWYKSSETGGPTVHFPLMELWVTRNSRSYKKLTKGWRVAWSDDDRIKIPALSGKTFATRRKAISEAEKVFVPMALLSPMIVSTNIKNTPGGM